MSEAKFKHYELKLLEPSFGSQLTENTLRRTGQNGSEKGDER